MQESFGCSCACVCLCVIVRCVCLLGCARRDRSESTRARVESARRRQDSTGPKERAPQLHESARSNLLPVECARPEEIEGGVVFVVRGGWACREYVYALIGFVTGRAKRGAVRVRYKTVTSGARGRRRLGAS